MFICVSVHMWMLSEKSLLQHVPVFSPTHMKCLILLKYILKKLLVLPILALTTCKSVGYFKLIQEKKSFV